MAAIEDINGTVFAYGATSIGLMLKMINVAYIVINKLLIKPDLHKIKLQVKMSFSTEIVPEPLGVALVGLLGLSWFSCFKDKIYPSKKYKRVIDAAKARFAEFRREEDADYPDFSDAARVSTNKAAFLELLNNLLLPIFVCKFV
ncbi:hypothetical protein ACFE04_004611 [Oxalis oulophora]